MFYDCSLSFQILALRLLQTVLPAWSECDTQDRTDQLVTRLFAVLGSCMLTCCSDTPSPIYGKTGITVTLPMAYSQKGIITIWEGNIYFQQFSSGSQFTILE